MHCTAQELQFLIHAIPNSLSSCALLFYASLKEIGYNSRDQDQHQKIDTRYSRITLGKDVAKAVS